MGRKTPKALFPRSLSDGALTRRNFVKASGGLVLATGIGGACGGDGGNGPVATGILQAIISGLDPSATAGGTVTVNALDVPGFQQRQVPLPPSGDSGPVPLIPIGNYRLAYTPPANHALAVGEANPKDRQVTEGNTTTVTWNVVASQSTVRVNVTGLNVGAADGGSALIVRTDIGGQSPVPLQIGGSGTADLGVVVGTYEVTYTPPTGYNINQGVVNPQSVNATAGNIATTTFAVTVQAQQFPTPDIVNNATFETNFDSFVNGSFTAPSGVTRDTTRAFHGTNAVRKVLVMTSGSDVGSACYFPFYAGQPFMPVLAQQHDRAWGRFYFYFDAAMNGILKFQIWEAASFSGQFGGFYCEGGNIGWAFIQEWNSQIHRFVAISSLVNGWHWLECDYWRNGDPSGFPSVGIWLDGNPVTSGINNPPSPGVWTNGRLNAGQRGSSVKLGTFNILGVLNGTPNNTVAGNVWVDRVACSSLGRIGP